MERDVSIEITGFFLVTTKLPDMVTKIISDISRCIIHPSSGSRLFWFLDGKSLQNSCCWRKYRFLPQLRVGNIFVILVGLENPVL